MFSRFFLTFSVTLISSLGFAQTQLVCSNNSQVFSTDSDKNTSFKKNCARATLNGDICYQGQTREAFLILQKLADQKILGEEFYISKIQINNKGQIKYEIYDGPMYAITDIHLISRCQ